MQHDVDEMRTGLDVTVSVDGSTMRGTNVEGDDEKKSSPGVRYFMK